MATFVDVSPEEVPDLLKKMDANFRAQKQATVMHDQPIKVGPGGETAIKAGPKDKSSVAAEVKGERLHVDPSQNFTPEEIELGRRMMEQGGLKPGESISLKPGAPLPSPDGGGTTAQRIGRQANRMIAGGIKTGLETVGVSPGVAEATGTIGAGLVPTSPTDVGQAVGSAGGMALGTFPMTAPFVGGPAGGAVLGGAAGRAVGSMFEEGAGPLKAATEATIGLVTGMVPSAFKRGVHGLRTLVALRGEKAAVGRVANDAIDVINDTFLPPGIPRLSKDVGVLQRQLSTHSTDESIIEAARRAYNGTTNLINATVGPTTIMVPTMSRNPVTISQVIQRIEDLGLRAGHSANRTPAQAQILITRDRILDEFNSFLNMVGLGRVSNAYQQARQTMAQTNEVARLLTQKTEGKRALNLAEGRIDSSAIQEAFLRRREAGRFGDIFPRQAVQRLETALARGSERGLQGTDVPFHVSELIRSFFTGSKGGISGRISTGMSLPRAAGLAYRPPSAAARIAIPPMMSAPALSTPEQ